MTSAPPSAAELPRSLVLVGAGKMGGAMLEGWLARGLDASSVVVLDPNPSTALDGLGRSAGFALNPEAHAIGRPEVVVLGIKPQTLGEAGPGIAPFASAETLVVSILAGKTIADLRRALPDAEAIVRAMPNLPASIGRGATGAFASAATSPRQRAMADALLAAVGIVEWVDSEEQIDAVTAVSGSGPAYVFHLVECLAAAGREVGLPAPLSERLARATIEGAAELLATSGIEPATLRQNVTSPGGTTAAALSVLMAENGLEPLMRKAVAAAKRRAGELAG